MGMGLSKTVPSETVNPKNAALIENEKIMTGQDGYLECLSMGYLYNYYKNTNIRSPSAYRLCYAIENIFHQVPLEGFPSVKPAKEDALFYKNNLKDPVGKVGKADWSALGQNLREMATLDPDLIIPLPLKNIDKLAESLKLDFYSKKVLEFIFMAGYNPMLAPVLDILTRETPERIGPALARFFDMPADYKAFHKTFDASSPLIRNGLIVLNSEEDSRPFPCIHPAILIGLYQEGFDPSRMSENLVGKLVNTRHKPEDFSYLAHDIDLVVKILECAIKDKVSGINIALEGPPGSGKSELAKVIAKAVGAQIYAVGEIADSSGRSVAQIRVGHLKQSLAVLEGKPALILFDEIDDLLLKSEDTSKKPDVYNKADLNNLLLTNKLPIIWTGNELDRFPDNVRQRFTFSIHMGYQPTLIRQKIWMTQAEMTGFPMREEDALDLARGYATPPRMIQHAEEVSKLVEGGLSEIIQTLKAGSKLVYGTSQAIEVIERVPKGFSPRCVNAGENTEQNVLNLIDRGIKGHRFSVFLKGKQGSGAGSLMRYVGEQLSMEVTEIPMKSVAAPNPMSTPEARLTAIFNAAEDNEQLLVLNDIEHISDGNGDNKWNTSLAEVFLKLASRHPAPFAVTTTKPLDLSAELNFLFTDTFVLKPFSAEQAEEAYQRFFQRQAPLELARINDLLPGDFSAVAKRIMRYGSDGLPDVEILKLLEVRKAMRGPESVVMGFRPGQP